MRFTGTAPFVFCCANAWPVISAVPTARFALFAGCEMTRTGPFEIPVTPLEPDVCAAALNENRQPSSIGKAPGNPAGPRTSENAGDNPEPPGPIAAWRN